MNDIFFRKLIHKCLLQYHVNDAFTSLSEEDYTVLLQKIRDEYERDETELHEIVENVVYEYITNS